MITNSEKIRLNAQIDFDLEKSQEERNKLGQFATPTRIANEIVIESLKYLTENEIRFLDPGIGTGSFFSALLNNLGKKSISKADGFDIDNRLVEFSNNFWSSNGLVVKEKDFTKIEDNEVQKVNLLIANPPYVRHHHLDSDDKVRLKSLVYKNLNINISGLAGLYCYFLLLSDRFLDTNSISAWLIPSEFLDVNYGVAVKKYLSDQVDLIRVHKFDPNNTQFVDALVSSTVVWFRKRKPTNEPVIFSTGDLVSPNSSNLLNRELLDPQIKWSTLFLPKEDLLEGAISFANLFKVKRGIATGANDFFVVDQEKIEKYKIPDMFLRPILPSPRQVKETVILGDIKGIPKNISKFFLFSSDMKFEDIKVSYPKVAEYITSGERNGISNAYLCSKRRPWYNQEKRDPPLFFCTYMGRSDGNNGAPFRFILNHSEAVATNVYLLLYPTAELKQMIADEPSIVLRISKFLNSISPSRLISGGRVYGGGLHKMEPKELGNLQIQLSEIGL